MKNKLDGKLKYISNLLLEIAKFNVENLWSKFDYFKMTDLVSVYIGNKKHNDYVVFYIYIDSHSLDEVRQFVDKVDRFIDLLHEGNDLSDLSKKLPYSSPKFVDTKHFIEGWNE